MSKECEHRNNHFDRSFCACGAMHTYCDDCGSVLDECPYEQPVSKARQDDDRDRRRRMSEIIRLEEAAYELRVSIRTLERMAKRGDIDIIRIGRLRRVRRADVDAIIEGRANVALPISQYDRERNATSGRYK